MSITVCLSANALYYPQGGGHLWVYLNWALGLCALGCRVIWLELVEPTTPVHEVQTLVAALKRCLERYSLAECVALRSETGEPLEPGAAAGCLDFEAAAEADLLLSLQCGLGSEAVRRFRRSALLDIDPGLRQIWMTAGQIRVARYDVYFTIGETVGRPGARFPDA